MTFSQTTFDSVVGRWMGLVLALLLGLVAPAHADQPVVVPAIQVQPQTPDFQPTPSSSPRTWPMIASAIMPPSPRKPGRRGGA